MNKDKNAWHQCSWYFTEPVLGEGPVSSLFPLTVALFSEDERKIKSPLALMDNSVCVSSPCYSNIGQHSNGKQMQMATVVTAQFTLALIKTLHTKAHKNVFQGQEGKFLLFSSAFSHHREGCVKIVRFSKIFQVCGWVVPFVVPFAIATAQVINMFSLWRLFVNMEKLVHRTVIVFTWSMLIPYRRDGVSND